MARADPVEIRIYTGRRATASPLTTFRVAWAGMVQSRTGASNVEADRETLRKMGCRVVGEEDYAGVTWLWVYFPEQVLHRLVDEYFKVTMPGVYVEVDPGTIPILPELKRAFSKGGRRVFSVRP